MQHGCLQRKSRQRGPAVWQFRWSETSPDGKRLYHKKIVGTLEQYPNEDAAQRSVVGLVSELNADGRPTNSRSATSLEFRSGSDGIRFGTRTRPCCEAWGLSSR